MKILVVEPRPERASQIRDILEQNGAEPTLAVDDRQAVTQALASGWSGVVVSRYLANSSGEALGGLLGALSAAKVLIIEAPEQDRGVVEHFLRSLEPSDGALPQ